MIQSKCKCGEIVLVETGRYDLCRLDGKRPHHPGDGPNTTRFRCRKCLGWLAETCEEASFSTAQDCGNAYQP